MNPQLAFQNLSNPLPDVPNASIESPESMRPEHRHSQPVRSGFTLIEIVIVIALIGTIFGLVIGNMGGIFSDNQEQLAKAFVTNGIEGPLMSYRLNMGSYPTTSEGLNALLKAPANAGSKWKGPYLKQDPIDPWQEPYEYKFPGTQNPGGYDLFSKGPDKTAGTADDIGNW